MRAFISNRWVGLLLLVISLGMTPAANSGAHPLDTWHLRSSLPGGQLGFTSVIWDDGLFVAVGGTNLTTSTNGVDWAQHNPALNGSMRKLAAGNGTYVAVGLYGLIASSPDGTNWTERSAATNSFHFTDVTYGNGLFVAVGEAGRILTSLDGTAWGQQNSGVPFRLDKVTCGRGIFVVSYTSGTNLLSADGTNWALRATGMPRNLYTMTYGGGQFLAIDTDRYPWLSPDGTNWVRHGRIAGIRPPEARWGNGQFVVLANPAVEYSSSGDVWRAGATNLVASGVAFANGSFVLAAGTRLYQSDPVVWLETRFPTGYALSGPPGSYTIEAATEIFGASWQAVTNLTLSTSPMLWHREETNGPSFFYRARFEH